MAKFRDYPNIHPMGYQLQKKRKIHPQSRVNYFVFKEYENCYQDMRFTQFFI